MTAPMSDKVVHVGPPDDIEYYILFRKLDENGVMDTLHLLFYYVHQSKGN